MKEEGGERKENKLMNRKWEGNKIKINDKGLTV